MSRSKIILIIFLLLVIGLGLGAISFYPKLSLYFFATDLGRQEDVVYFNHDEDYFRVYEEFDGFLIPIYLYRTTFNSDLAGPDTPFYEGLVLYKDGITKKVALRLGEGGAFAVPNPDYEKGLDSNGQQVPSTIDIENPEDFLKKGVLLEAMVYTSVPDEVDEEQRITPGMRFAQQTDKFDIPYTVFQYNKYQIDLYGSGVLVTDYILIK